MKVKKKKISKWIDRINGNFVTYSKIYPQKGGPFIKFINATKAKGANW